MSEGMGNRGRSLGHGSRAGAKWDKQKEAKKRAKTESATGVESPKFPRLMPSLLLISPPMQQLVDHYVGAGD
jgi:hypothetical protein